MIPAVAPAVAPTMPVRSIPDVWAAPSRGMPWCDCGEEPEPLTESTVHWFAQSLYGDLPERLTHAQVVDIAAEVWQMEDVCRFFTLGVEDAARGAAGAVAVAVDYPARVALAIVKVFSDRWNGCPEKACVG